jgi:hypothetical protein
VAVLKNPTSMRLEAPDLQTNTAPLTSADRRTEDIRIGAVVVTKLKLSNVQRAVGSVERSKTHHLAVIAAARRWGSLRSTHPTGYGLRRLDLSRDHIAGDKCLLIFIVGCCVCRGALATFASSLLGFNYPFDRRAPPWIYRMIFYGHDRLPVS